MQYEIGSIVTYENFLGKVVKVRVTEKSADIKNGRPGFIGDIVEVRGGKLVTVHTQHGLDYPDGAWGYDSQIVNVGR